VDPESRRAKRDLEIVMEHGGDAKRWLEHRWRKERRETPPEKLEELHERWFSANVQIWREKFAHIDTEFDLLRHHVIVSLYLS
jgi:chitinase